MTSAALAGVPHTEVASAVGHRHAPCAPVRRRRDRFCCVRRLTICSPNIRAARTARHQLYRRHRHRGPPWRSARYRAHLGGTSEMPLPSRPDDVLQGRPSYSRCRTDPCAETSADGIAGSRRALPRVLPLQADVLKASGLSAPIPGMADMEGKGHFFDCEPYGKCWEPTPATQHPEPATAQARIDRGTEQACGNTARSPKACRRSLHRRAATSASSGRPPLRDLLPDMSDMDSFFPCIPDECARHVLSHGRPVPDAAMGLGRVQLRQLDLPE